MTRDIRHYAKQTNIRLTLGFIILLFLVGEGLIYVIYGRNAALIGLLCLTIGLAPIFLIVMILWIGEWIVNRSDK